LEKSAVSLLNRNRSAQHLDDGAFTRLWTEETSTGQPASDAHLNACAQCRDRYDAFTQWLDRLRDDAHAEADDAFPAERLAAQQAHILRRLETLERPARVIAFPRFARPVTSTQGGAQRWVAAAAAAGLVIGLFAGQFVDFRGRFGHRPVETNLNALRTPAPSPVTAGVNPAPAPAAATSADESLFYGGDLAQNYVRISTLQPMDSITPRARDLDRGR
jgi:hypothetical protein